MIAGRGVSASPLTATVRTTAIVLLGLAVLFPIYWMIVVALTPTGFGRQIASFVPRTITFDNFIALFTTRPMAQWIANSIIVAVLASGLSLVLGISCGYALSRLRFRGANLLLIAILATQMIPATSIIVPLYTLFRAWGLLDTMQGMVVGHISLVIPLAVWMGKGFFDSIPRDLENAARIDGCTHAGAFFHIALPLAAPGLAAIFIYGFVTSWNDFLFSHTLVISQEVWTAANGIASFRGEYFTLQEMQMAAALVFALPVVVVFFVMQRWIVSGALAGSVR